MARKQKGLSWRGREREADPLDDAPVEQSVPEDEPEVEEAVVGSYDPSVVRASMTEAASIVAAGGRLGSTANRAQRERPSPKDAKMDSGETERFGEFLVRHGTITPSQLEAAVSAQAGDSRIGEVLVMLGVLDERTLTSALAEFFGFPICDLRTERIEPEALLLIDEGGARQYQAMPFRVTDDSLLVAVAEPSEGLRNELTTVVGKTVELWIAPHSDVIWAIDKNYRVVGGIDVLVREFEAAEGGKPRRGGEVEVATFADDAPIVQVVDRIISQAIRDRASDIHIEPADKIVRIRFRIDGALSEILQLPGSMGMGLVSRIKIMAEMNIVERRRPQDGQLTAVVDGVPIDVRVATIATIWGETCVMRVLDKTRSVFKMSQLGMSDETHKRYSELVRAPFGMVLCAGPTGSGKTTTLYATLTEVADPSRNVMTIEDPVEYVFPTINQIQTNEAAGLSFASGLKSILRQDPDVILVGEIRDVETARIAVQSALTGHFVLSSLHATDAVSAVLRFLDMGIESFLIASSVLAIVGQRLVRRICPACKVAYELTEEEQSFYEAGGGTEKDVFYHGVGCNFCSGNGYKERIGVYEVLEVTPEIRHLIVEHGAEDDIRAMARKQGMHTMREQALDLVAKDVTTVSEVIRSIYVL